MAHVEENKLTSQLGICRGKADVQKNPAQTDFNACSFLKKIWSKSNVWSIITPFCGLTAFLCILAMGYVGTCQKLPGLCAAPTTENIFSSENHATVCKP